MKFWPNVRVFDPASAPAHHGEVGHWFSLVEVCRRAGLMQEARAALDRALLVCANPSELSTYWWFSAALCRQTGQFEASNAAFRRSFQLSKAGADKFATTMACAGLAENARIAGDYRNAWRLHAMLLEAFSRHQEPRGISWALGGLGQLALLRGSHAIAFHAFSRAYDSAVFASDSRAKGWALRGLGLSLLKAAPNAAGVLLDESLKTFEECNFKAGQAWTTKALGDHALTLGRTAAANDLLQSAVSQFRLIGDPRGEAFASLTRSTLLLLESDEGHGNATLNATLDLFDRQKLRPWSTRCTTISRDNRRGQNVFGRLVSLTIPGWKADHG